MASIRKSWNERNKLIFYRRAGEDEGHTTQAIAFIKNFREFNSQTR